MYGIVIKIILYTGFIVASFYLVASIFRRSRMISIKLAELRKEEAALKASGKVVDPYKAFAELYQQGNPEGRSGLFGGKKKDG